MSLKRYMTGFFAFFFLISAISFLSPEITRERTELPGITEIQPSPRVILDPGHGGQDGGATGVGGVSEKDINLEIALCLRDIFLLGGWQVTMTRDSDDDTDGRPGFNKKDDIHARADFAAADPEALFLGVHMNASPASRDQGFTAFYGTRNPDSLGIAEKIASSVGNSGLTTRLRQTKASPDTVYIFRNVPNPSVLLEFGFVTNPDDCALLLRPEYRTGYSVTVFCGVTCP